MNASKIDFNKLELSFSELTKKINKHGYRKNINESLSLFEYFSHIVLHTFFFLLAIEFSSNIITCTLFLFFMMLSGIGITTGTHTASHFSLVSNKKLNSFLVYLGYGFFFGASYQYWMHKHIVVHHPSPNIIDVDEDINLMPFFVLNQTDFENASSFKKKYFKLQFLIIPFALTLNLFNVQKDGIVHLFKEIKKKKIKKKYLLDLSVMSSHFIFWLIIPCFFFDFTQVLVFYYLRAAFMGYGMFFAFAPAHFPHNAFFLSKDNKHANFIIKQIYTTTNFRTGIIGKYILGGVQFQIEHHLFPNCHHYHYPKINQLLVDFCKENNLPYNEISWFKGIWESFKVFYKPKKVFSNEIITIANNV